MVSSLMRVLVKWSNALTGSYVCFVWSHHFSITFELFNVLLQRVFVFLFVAVVVVLSGKWAAANSFGAPQRYKRKMSSDEEDGEGEKREKARSKKKNRTTKAKNLKCDIDEPTTSGLRLFS